MGQYYLVANMDKREVLQVKGRFPGKKLLEIAETAIASQAILNQLAWRWKADHVYLIGDYADLEYASHQYYQTLRDWTDKFHLTDSLYYYVQENFQPVEGNTEDQGYRFVYNHMTKEYIDMAHCPRCCDGTDWRQGFIAPLPLLIAMGNGCGSGDYRGLPNEHLVGTWCDSITAVEIKKELDDSLGYKEFHPDFRY